MLTLIAGLSCSEKSKIADEGEGDYPDFSEPKKASLADDGMTLCSSKPDRPHYHVVQIRQMKFEPENLTLKKGDTVVWVNCDITNHDVTERTRNAWHSGSLSNSQSWMKIVSEGSDYYCSIHVVMKGKLTVE
jgi:plastocyanin